VNAVRLFDESQCLGSFNGCICRLIEWSSGTGRGDERQRTNSHQKVQVGHLPTPFTF
jgi:hypothetical protein